MARRRRAAHWQRTFPRASPVTIIRLDGTRTTEPALTKRQLDRLVDQSKGRAVDREAQTSNRPVILPAPCATCGCRLFWDNRRFKELGKYPPSSPDYRCTECRQGR